MTVIVFEQFSRTAPLGLRFWDMAARRPVTGGLKVTARTPQKRVLPLSANSTGVYVLQNDPALRRFEGGDGSDEFWADAPAPLPYQITVRDTSQHYHSFTFTVDVPTHKIASWTCVNPLVALDLPESYVPAYTTSSHPVPPGMAALRADLYDPAADKPAVHAVLEVLLNGVVLGRSIADPRGCVLVTFPVPTPIDTDPADPDSFGVPLMQQVWNLSLRAFYAPVDPVPDVMDLCAVLNQPAANLWRRWISAANRQAFTTVALRYGRETSAVSFTAGDTPLSRLFLTPV
jgi:hypothetical protein